jgi:CHAT domain-containing protein/tetratricopeptide (TPR) repeat protein
MAPFNSLAVAQTRTLEAQRGLTIQGNFDDNGNDSYSILVRAGQYIRVSVDAIGTELETSLTGPTTHDVKTAWVQPADTTSFAAIADVDEQYILRLRPTSSNTRGKYSVSIEDSRDAVSSDRQMIQAEDLLRRGRELVREQKEESFRSAINAFQKAQEISRPIDEGRLEAEALMRIGECLASLSDNQSALNYFKQALAKWLLIGDLRGQSETVDDIGGAYFNLGDRMQALKYLNDSLELSRQASLTLVTARVLNDLGVVVLATGDHKKALDYLHQSLGLFETLGDQRQRGETLISIGVSYQGLGMQDRAIDAFGQATPFIHAYHDRSAEAILLNNLAKSYSAIGEKQNALDRYREALPIEQEVGDRQGEGDTLSNIGKIYEDFGDLATSGEYYQKSLEVALLIKDLQLEMVAQVHLASIAEESGGSLRALELLSQAMTLSKAVHDHRWEGIILNSSAHVQCQLGNLEKSLSLYVQALSVEREVGDPSEIAIILSNIADVQVAEGETDKALTNYEEALADARLAGDPRAEAITLYSLARTRSIQADYLDASVLMKQATGIVESLRGKIITPELRSSYLASVRDYFDFYIDTLMRLQAAHPGEGYDVQAFNQCERSRARSLVEMLNESGVDVREGVDATLLERSRSITQQLDRSTDLEFRLARAKGKQEELQTVRMRVQELQLQYQTVEEEIRRVSPRYAALTQPQPLTAKQVQQELLDANTILLELALGKERSYLFALTPTSLAAFELPKRAEIEETAHNVYGLLTSRNRWIEGETGSQRRVRIAKDEAGYPKAAAMLGQMILGPVVEKIKGKRLLIVADGALQYIPFQILPVPAKDPSTQRIPLVAEHEIVNLPSASVLALLRRQANERAVAPKEVAVVADPVFDKDDSRVEKARRGARLSMSRPPTPTRDPVERIPYGLTRSLADARGATRDTGSGLPRLVFSRREADAIMAATDSERSTEALDFKADRDLALSKELGQYRIVHFATHGLLDNEHPELSGLVLSLVDSQGSPKNGFLELQDIYNLDLPIDLVVLSACETGLGKQISGEGLIGLARGFMYAGAPRVVASLWKVDDVATADLMGRFYKAMLKEKMRPAAALREAQLEMSRVKRWTDPYDWAAFTIQGEWR